MATFVSILLLFFLSGFSALVYQVVWQRLLGLFTGAEVVAVTLITSAYMLGMGVGSLAGGAIADRLKSRSGLFFLFAASELTIALFGVASKSFFYDFLHLTVPHLANSKVLAFVILFCALLLPTFLMGMTLPFLSRAFVTSIEKAVDRIALLYAMNTLGAAVGSVFAATILVRNFGYENSLYIGAAISLLCALGTTALGFNQLKSSNNLIASPENGFSECVTGEPSITTANNKSTTEAEPMVATFVSSQIPFGFKTWLVLSALSGFIALGLEIVWFRLLKVMLKANSMTYGWLLFVYLVGLALGTFIGARVAKTCKNPSVYFCLCQCLIGVYTILSVGILTKNLGSMSYTMPLFEFFGRYNPIDFGTEQIPAWDLFNLYVALPGLLIIPPTVLMGMSFCYLQKIIQNDLRLIGRRLGWLQAANIAGSTLGALFVGLVSLHHFGTAGTLLIVLMLSCVFLFLYLFQCWVANSSCVELDRKTNNLAAGVCLDSDFAARADSSSRSSLRLSRALISGALSVGLYALLASGFPTSKQIWMKLHGHNTEHTFIVKEDGSGVAAMVPVDGDSMEKMFVYINGQGHSELPYGLYHSQLGLLALFVHPEPKDIAIIGLGSGDTLYASGAHKATTNITCFEIVKPAFHCILEWHDQKPYMPIESLITDKRVRVVFADGRKGLQREGKKYDIIQQDPLRSFDAGAGMLYSMEYFKMLQQHLKPGGYVVLWSPTVRTKNTFVKAFPYAVDFCGTLIGSREPILVDQKLVRHSFNVNRIEGYLEKTGVGESLLKEVLDWYSGPVERGVINSSDVNHDLNPKDEFMVPQS
jgi:spermidine synthase